MITHCCHAFYWQAYSLKCLFVQWFRYPSGSPYNNIGSFMQRELQRTPCSPSLSLPLCLGLMSSPATEHHKTPSPRSASKTETSAPRKYLRQSRFHASQVFPRPRSSYTSTLTYSSKALALICRNIAPSCRPGPISNVLGNLSPAGREYIMCIVCSHMIGFHICSSRCRLIDAAPGRCWRDVTFEWTGTAGLLSWIAASERDNGAMAECIRREWNAPETGMRVRRCIPNSLAFRAIKSSAYTQYTAFYFNYVRCCLPSLWKPENNAQTHDDGLPTAETERTECHFAASTLRKSIV